MGQVDPLRFRDQTKHLSVAVETPWPTSFADLQGGLAIPIEEHDARLSRRVFVRKLDSRRAVPFDVDHRDQAIGHNALDGGSSF